MLRWAISLAVLAALLVWLEPADVVAEIAGLEPLWLVGALAISVVQMLLSAWRWRFTAERLGLRLPWPRAIGDYYLAGFVNQVLPGGVLGDALRAHRHARDSDAAGPAWRAVIIERASGQAVVVLGTLAVLALVPAWRDALAGLAAGSGAAWLAPALFALIAGAAVVAAARRWPTQWRRLHDDIQRSLLAPGAWPRQLAASLAIVSSYVFIFALAGLGIGSQAGFWLLLAVALPILLAMLIPLSVAGWGFREAAAAAVWLALGLPPEQGAAVALAYGGVVLVASLPGALVLLHRPGR